MADQKLTDLTALPSALVATDLIYVVRSNTDYQGLLSDLQSVNGVAISGTCTPTLAVTGTTTVSGSNTGDQTNISGNAATVTTNANLTGDVTSVGNATTLTNAPVIAKVLTGYTSGAGTVAATDSILQAIQKLNGNDATNANLTGDVTSVGNATTLAAGSAANLNSGTLAAARMPALTGDVTTTVGAVATTIAAAAVTLAKMANLAQDQFIGRTTASTGVPETATITAAARTVLDDRDLARHHRHRGRGLRDAGRPSLESLGTRGGHDVAPLQNRQRIYAAGAGQRKRHKRRRLPRQCVRGEE